jgi:uncharacterized protein (DUF488 family)
MGNMTIVTIGVYGFDETGFFAALRAAAVDLFCDIRFRRGVRGRQYAFANSQRLQARLAELGIHYVHRPEVAPSPALRIRQTMVDKRDQVRKRQRMELTPEFIAGYEEERLGTFDSHAFVRQVGPQAKVIALFCVEREPAACHRSLLASRLKRDLGVEVIHLKPS